MFCRSTCPTIFFCNQPQNFSQQFVNIFCCLLLSGCERITTKLSKLMINVDENNSLGQRNMLRRTVIDKIMEAECTLRKQLRRRRRKESFCTKVQPGSRFQTPNAFFTKLQPGSTFETSNAFFELVPRNANESMNPKDYVLDVVSVNINSSLIDVFLANETRRQTIITNHFLRLEKIGHYSVLGFEDFNDGDDDMFVDLNLSVRFNWTIQPDNASTAFRTFLNQNQAKIFAVKSASLKCVFINIDEGSYSDSGCQSNSTSDFRHISCECDHATVFTIILSVSVINVPFTVEV